MTKSAQVICITHLAQIAALADKHFLIEKKTENGRTRTEITPLEGDLRVNEIARIIGGEVITDLTRENEKSRFCIADEIKNKLKNKSQGVLICTKDAIKSTIILTLRKPCQSAVPHKTQLGKHHCKKRRNYFNRILGRTERAQKLH